MTVQKQIKDYIAAQPEPKRSEMEELHHLLMTLIPAGKLWFLDGKDEKGKIVSNPNIGYGSQIIRYANGNNRDFRLHTWNRRQEVPGPDIWAGSRQGKRDRVLHQIQNVSRYKSRRSQS